MGGTPSLIAFIATHSAIFGGLSLCDQEFVFYNLVQSKQSLKQGKYHTLLTTNFIHNSVHHLYANTVAFTPYCYRLICCIDKQNTKRSIRIFWSIYIACGFLGSCIGKILEDLYEKHLLFYLQGNKKMSKQINDGCDYGSAG